MSPQEQLKNKLTKEHGSLSAAARFYGLPRGTLEHRIKRGLPLETKQERDRLGTVGVKNLAHFRAAHDKDFIIPARIKEGLRKLGKAGWEYEVQFAKLAGVGIADLHTYSAQFETHVVEVGKKRAWAGSQALAQNMREMVR